VRLVESHDKGIQRCASGWRVTRDVGGEELAQGGTWVQVGAARDIDYERGGANRFCVYRRKGETERI